MANALEMFKQQKAALEALHETAQRIEVSLQRARADLDALARHEALHQLLVQEQRWLARTEAAVQAVHDWRYTEAQHYGGPLAWRWAVAAAFALLTTAAAAAGYVWAARPHAAEIEDLRSRSSLADAVEARMLRMTPAERRQLDALLKLPTRSE